MRVLVLEDNGPMRTALAAALEDEGYEVVVAGRGEEAVARASEMPFDLVVTDIRMEGMDGLEALERVKLQQPDVQSLVVTGYSTEADSIRAIRLGAGDYLKKPFSLVDFLERVASLVRQRLAEQSRAERERGLWRLALHLGWTVAELLEQAGAPPLRRAARVAACLADELGLDDRDKTVLTALLCGARHACRQAPQALGRIPELLPDLARCWEHLNERWDGSGEQIPFDARLAAVALAATLLGNGEEPLRERYPGRFDPILLGVLERLTPEEIGRDPLDTRPAPAPQHRGLLSLGRALEESGEPVSAGRAYLRVIRTRPSSREAIAARQGLARVAAAAGKEDQAREHLEESHRVARRLGPVAAGESLLFSGLMLLGRDRHAALPWLEEAERILGEVGSPASLARAHLAARLCSRGPIQASALRTLLKTAHAAELLSSAPWLLGGLLERGEAAFSEALLRLLRDAPEALGDASLSETARLRAVEALEAVGSAAPQEAVRQLLADPSEEVRRRAARLQEQLQPQSSVPRLRIYSLGPFEVFLGGRRVPNGAWKTSKVKFLLAYILARGDRPVAEDCILEEFWPGPAERGKRNLKTALSTLRRCLCPEESLGPRYVARSMGQLRWNPEFPCWHDLDELEAAARQAARLEESGQPREARAEHRKVVQLARGPYLEECYMDWAAVRRPPVEELVCRSLTRLALGALSEGRHEEALECALRLLETDGCNQEAAQVAMQAQLGLGRAEEAVRQYRLCQRRLQQELSMEPSVDLFEVYQRALLSLSGGPIG